MEADHMMDDCRRVGDRMEDAIIDAVAGAFQTLFRMPVSWRRGERAESSDVRCDAEIRGAIEGSISLSMPMRTAQRLIGLITRRESVPSRGAIADAIGELGEMLFVGAVERAAGGTADAGDEGGARGGRGVRGGRGARVSCDAPAVTVLGPAMALAAESPRRVRVAFDSECGPFHVAVEFPETVERDVPAGALGAVCLSASEGAA